jgi:hypothetical protein
MSDCAGEEDGALIMLISTRVPRVLAAQVSTATALISDDPKWEAFKRKWKERRKQSKLAYFKTQNA